MHRLCSRAAALLVGLSLSLHVSASRYEPDKGNGGFGEIQMSDISWIVYFKGDKTDSAARIQGFFLYRCAEATLQKGFTYFSLRPYDGKISAQNHERVLPATWHPETKTFSLIKTAASTGTPPSGSGWINKAMVNMFSALPEDVPIVYDARIVLADLKAFHDSDGATSAIDGEEVLAHSVQGHVQIQYGEAATSAVAPNPSVNHSSVPLRDKAAIQKQIQKYKENFMALFYRRKQITGRTDGGTVVLGFTVTPDGFLADNRLVSTTFSDPVFAKAIVSMIQKINFGPANASATRVEAFPITFGNFQ